MQAITRPAARRTPAPALLAAALAGTLMAGGCLVGPNYRPPQANVPTAWTGVSEAAVSQPSVATAQPAQLAQWWRVFNDPNLTALVEEALKVNLDLQLAEARLRQARAAQGVAAGGLWPAVNASALYRRSQPSGAPAAARAQPLYQAGLDAAWELDLFGGISRSVEAADADVEAAQENLRDVQVSLIAEIALNYVQLRSFQQQIVIAQDNLRAQKHTADLTRQRLGAGFVSALDVANAEAQVATTQSQIPILQSAARQSIYALSILLARFPAELAPDLSQPGPVPVAPALVPVGLPSDLLRRRPDIRQAEAQLHAATAQIGVATADFFPRFSLTGSLGWENPRLSALTDHASRFWSYGPAASWPIFQGGSIISNVRVREAIRDQTLLAYQKTVLTALQEVENALVAFAREQEHRQALSDAVAANRRALDLALQLYTQGQTDFLNVLNAQRSLYASEEAWVQSNQNVAANFVALYKALGGGWEMEPSPPPALAATPRDESATPQAPALADATPAPPRPLTDGRTPPVSPRRPGSR